MKRLGILLSLILLAGSGQALAAEKFIDVDRNLDVPSFIGWVPDKVIVVLKEDAATQISSRALTSRDALSAIPELATIGQQFNISRASQQFEGAKLSMTVAATERKMARHFKVTFDPTKASLDEVVQTYSSADAVEDVQKIGIHTIYATPNDTYYDNPPPEFPYDQWHYWNNNSIDADQAWDTETGSSDVVVGILDSGTRYFHIDLGGNSAQWGPDNPFTGGNIFINPNEIPGNGIDDDGNGYIDDVVGYDFIETTGGLGVTCIDQDCGTKDNDPDDGNGHGTHVAGTVGAITNNARQVAGVAGGYSDGTTSGVGNGVRILPCRIGYHASYFGQQVGLVDMAAAAEAMWYISGLIDAGHNVTAINCSWGSSNSGGLDAAVDNLINNKDVLVVVAAGNSGNTSQGYLNGRGDCLDVAATDINGNGASFSNYGSWVEVAAPGVEILSTYRNPDDPDPGAHYIALLDGTSMAAPHVAGIAALLESCNPALSGPDKYSLIVNNVDPYNDSRDLGSGIANARKAMDAAGCTGGGCDLVADFSGTPTSGCAPLSVNFTDLSTGSGIDGWSWDFGDGGTSTAQNPSYTYNSPGTYNVTLTVSSSTQACNDVATKSGYITVNGAPTADFVGSPTTGTEPLTVDFTDQSTNATSWSWDFGDGVGTSTQQNPSYTYNTAGTYTVTLTATNACGSDVATKVDYITVDPCVAPVADFSGTPTTGTAPLTVNFSDLSTGNPTSWSWDFGDGNASTAQNPSHEYTAAGTYTVSLTASNACGSDAVTKLDYITVDAAPAFTDDFAVADIPVDGSVSGSYLNTHVADDVYQSIQEILAGNARNGRSSLEHKWQFNVTGGSTVDFFVEAYRDANAFDDFTFAYSTDDATYFDLVTVTNASPDQVYTAALPASLSGTVYIRVVDTNNDRTETSLQSIHVDQMYIRSASGDAPPIAAFSGVPTSGQAPLTVQFTDESTGNPTSWSWDFGDGGTSTAQHPSHEYTAVGTYTVSLTVTNDVGSDTHTATDYITVTDQPVGGTMWVNDIVVTRKTAGPNCSGVGQVWIYDANGPVANATVSATATGPVPGTFSGLTGADGSVTFETGKTKSCGGEWCFEVTDVTHGSLTYDPASNVWTKACESGGVFNTGGAITTTGVPTTFELGNHPNPFNPTTTISFSLTQPSQVKLEVYNIAGQRVSTLVDDYKSAGTYTVEWDGANMASGVYLYRIETNEGALTRKMMLIK